MVSKCMIFFQTGTTANAAHMQMYLLDGLHRWNTDRSNQNEGVQFHNYDTRMAEFISQTSARLLGNSVIPVPRLPAPYTGKTGPIITT